MTSTSTLLIDQGDLPSLAAVAIEPHPDSLLLWHPVRDGAAARHRLQVVQDHADTFGVKGLINVDQRETGVPGLAIPPRLQQTRMLVDAATAAVQLGCPRLIWPLQVGSDFQAIADAVDRAHAVCQLVESDGRISDQPLRLTIDLPMVDLNDVQILELVDDVGAPLNGFWPCSGDERPEHATSPFCQRWRAAFTEAGIPWPWQAAEPAKVS